MRKSILSSLTAFFMAAVLVLFGACSDITDSSEINAKSSSAENGRATVSFALASDNGRTIMPDNLELNDTVQIILSVEMQNEKGEYEEILVEPNPNWTADTDKYGVIQKSAYDNMISDSLTFEYGTYNFKLELYAHASSEDSTPRLVQVAELKNVEINQKTETLEFEAKYVDSGVLSLKLQWDEVESRSPIGGVKAALYEISENGTIGNLIEGTKKEPECVGPVQYSTDKIVKKFYMATYSLETEVPNGSYWVKIQLYDNEEETKILNTITEIVKINGFRTEKTLELDISKLNILYNVAYSLGADDASWVDGVEENLVTRRNAYTGVVLPTNEYVTRNGYKLVGWKPENSSEVLEEIEAGSSSAKDYALTAQWIEHDAHSLKYMNIDGIVESVTNPQSFKETEEVTLLETVSKTYYTFEGWYTDADCTEGNEISGWKAGDKTGDVTVYAKWTLVPTLYVSPAGSDKNDGTAQNKALDSIDAAVDVIASVVEKDADWTIYVSGEVKGAQTVSSSLTAEVAKSLTIAGLSKNTIDDSEYTDILNGNFDENNAGTTLTIETEIPVTIANLQITGGYYPVIESDNNYAQGGGIKIAAGSTKVMLDNALISGNKSDCGAAIELNVGTLVMKDSVVKDNEAISELGFGTGGIIQVDPETKFFMYGSSVIGDKNAKERATETSYSNKGDNPGIYNSRGFVYLGYSGFDDSGNPIKAALTGGIYGNYGRTSAIFNDSGTLYMNSGTIKYNTVADEESQVTYTGEGSTFVMMGGSIESNSGTVDVAGSWDSVVSPFTLDGEVGIDTELRCRAKGVVTIGSNFKTKNPIPLSVETYEEGLEVLAPATGVTLTSDIIANFSLVQPDDGVTWVITTDGKLKKLVADSTFQITLESVKSDDTGIVSLGVDGSSVEATIATGYSVYAWTIDDEDYELEGSTLDFSKVTLGSGVVPAQVSGAHNIMVIVVNDTDKDDYYSATVVFTVTKE